MNTIICFGDSLVSGYGLRKGEGWCELLKRDKSLAKNCTILNKGVPGDTTTGLLSRSYRDVLELKPQIVIVLIGTNDLLLGRSVDVVFENLTFILSELLIHNIKPILLSPPGIVMEMAEENFGSSNIYLTVNKRIELLIEKLKKYSSDNKISFIDLYDFFHNVVNMDNFSTSRDLYIDGIHLNGRGNILMASKIEEILKV